MTRVAVLGNGQLGWMLGRAGDRLGIEVTLIDPEAGQMPDPEVIVTTEREHWPENDFTSALQKHPGWLHGKAIDALVDRRQQKALLDRLRVPTARWLNTADVADPAAIAAELDGEAIVKRASWGYDGKGQWRPARDNMAPEWWREAIAEQLVDFATEVSLVGARDRHGNYGFYPLVENLHGHGTLEATIAIEGRWQHLQESAETMLRQVMEALEYTGVMAMECFVTREGGLLVNEIAPRVHNSGHWTQVGASPCQFELHLRAIADLPMPAPRCRGATLMLNLLGCDWSPRWLEHPAVRLYWYGKEKRPRRKMGHLNVIAGSQQELLATVQQLDLPGVDTGLLRAVENCLQSGNSRERVALTGAQFR